MDVLFIQTITEITKLYFLENYATQRNTRSAANVVPSSVTSICCTVVNELV